ncbi:MAG: type II secretion system protein GspC [Chromatiales bacterium]|nr:type II secretion system protein GspC [Chromatiales bacterium]
MLSTKWFKPSKHVLSLESVQGLAGVVGVLATLLLAHSLAGLSWQLLPSDSAVLPGGPAPLLASSAARDTSGTPNLELVAGLSLFGRAEQVQAAPSAPVQAPETRLSLQLRGILMQQGQGQRLALIGQGNAEEQVFRIGDEPSTGVRVHDILADRVILSRAGRFETLSLPKERMDVSAAASSGAARPSTAAPTGMDNELRELRNTLIQNPQDAMNLINIQPVMADGQIRGYSVRPGQDRRMFSSIGLRPGDIVTRVNGLPVSDPSQLGALYQQFTSAPTLNITVERRGRSMELSLNLE